MGQVRQDNVQIKLEIDGSQSKTELDNLTRKAQVLQQGLKEMKRGTDEYIAANKELRQVNARIDELRNTLGLAGLSTGQVEKLMKQLNRELKDLVPGTAAYIAKSEELVKVENHYKQVRADLDEVRNSLGNAGLGFSDFIKKAVGFAGIQLGIEAVVGSLKQLGTESINAALKGSDSISDMEKSLNVTTAEAKALRDQLENIDTRTSQENLEGIAIAAGQLGIAKDQAVAFTTSVDQAVVALGDEFTGGVEDVTKSLGGLQKLFKETADIPAADAITKIGSAVNALGADGTATGPVIADFAARIGQLGNLAPQITQTLGLGAAFQELGLSAEISAGGLTNILLTAAKGTADFGKQLGMTTQEFEDLINNDPNEVIIRLAASLKGASETQIVTTLDKLGIKSQEATKVISLLADKSDFVRAKQRLANDEYDKGTSLLDEFAKKNTNAAAEVEKAEKTFARYRQELGEQLLPVYLRVLQYTTMVVDVLRALPGFVSENRVAFGLLALAIAAYNAEQIGAQLNTIKSLALQKLVALGVLTEVEGKYSLVTATGALTAAQRGLDAAYAASPIGFVLTLIAAFAFGLKQLYDRSETFRAAVDSLTTMLRPLGTMLGNLVAQAGPLGALLGKFFSSLSGGKSILELFGYLMGVSVVLPLKLLITQLQLAADQFNVFMEVGKRVANFFGASFKLDPSWGFDGLSKNLKANGESMLTTLAGQDKQRTEQEDAAFAERKQRYQKRVAEFLQKHTEAAKEEARKEKEIATASDLESLKAREANIRAALALVESGSAEELRLKKLLVTTKRDIDLLGEKKTAGDKKVIVAEALRDLRQLQDEYDKNEEKRAKERADVEKHIADLKTAFFTDETEKRIAQLIAAAEKEKATAKGTAEQIIEQRRLIEQKLALDVVEVRRAAAVAAGLAELEAERMNSALIKNQFDRKNAEIDIAAKEAKLKLLATDKDYAIKAKLIDDKTLADHKANEQERVDYHQQVLDKIAAMEEETAQLTRGQKLKGQDVTKKDRKDAAAQELAEKIGNLNKEEQAEQEVLARMLEDKLITAEEFEQAQTALFANYRAKRKDINDQFAEAERSQWKADFEEAVTGMSEKIQLAAGLFKDFSDIQLKREESDKKKRLASLEAEYKAGRISKEGYEAAKSEIEANYDAKTRQIKKEAAEKEKVANIAQAVIQTAVNVVKAFPNPIQMTAAAALGAFQIGKIVATPIPEFEQGGVFGQAWRGVKQFARGGRINPRAGVADVGQRHSGGGIRMVDGATGEHLGEWERGEAYMILSRDTYANNKHLVDELIDTSLHRGGAPVRRQEGYYEDGGTFGSSPAMSSTTAAGNGGQELVQAVNRVENAIKALPAWVRIHWDQEDTAAVEQLLNERAADRAAGQVR